ncbi:MAG: hypothetical protein ACE5GL_06360 [Calditrichia bacterium]
MELEQYYRRDLETQIHSQKLKRAIEKIRAIHSILNIYPVTEDLIVLVQPGNRNYSDKDKILRIILVELKTDFTLFPLLNLMFWDSLLRLYWRKCKSVPNHNELFSRIQMDFFHTAVLYPLERRPRKIDVNLILDTKKKVTKWQREEILYSDRHDEFQLAHENGQSLNNFQTTHVFPEEMEEYLLDLVYRKIINEKQYDLLLETQVYKRMSQKEWAEARCLRYSTIRSWRFRAYKVIRKYEKERGERTE